MKIALVILIIILITLVGIKAQKIIWSDSKPHREPIITIPVKVENKISRIVIEYADKKGIEDKNKEQLIRYVQNLKSKLKFTEVALENFFRILEIKQVPFEKLYSTLEKMALDHKELKKELKELRNSKELAEIKISEFPRDTKVVFLIEQSSKSIEEGKFSEAKKSLHQASIEISQGTTKEYLFLTAKLKGINGNLALVELNYNEASKYFKETAKLLPIEYESERDYYLSQIGFIRTESPNFPSSSPTDTQTSKNSSDQNKTISSSSPKENLSPDRGSNSGLKNQFSLSNNEKVTRGKSILPPAPTRSVYLIPTPLLSPNGCRWYSAELRLGNPYNNDYAKIPLTYRKEYIPPHTRGDRDFKGHGPNIWASVNFRIQPYGIYADVWMKAEETKKDHSTAEGKEILWFLHMKDGWTIQQVAEELVPENGHLIPRNPSPVYSSSDLEFHYRDDDHGMDAMNVQDKLVFSVQFMGDTKGKEAGTRTRIMIDSKIRAVCLAHLSN